jgi:hypothetical protein
MKRDKAIETVKGFPQEFELEDLIERLVFLEKVEKGLRQVEQGQTTPHEKVKEMANLVSVFKSLTIKVIKL